MTNTLENCGIVLLLCGKQIAYLLFLFLFEKDPHVIVGNASDNISDQRPPTDFFTWVNKKVNTNKSTHDSM